MITGSSKFIADGSGGQISVVVYSANATVDRVHIQKLSGSVEENKSVKTLLEGQTDEGEEIVLRVDSQTVQLLSDFELYSYPLAIVNRTQRGSQMKCFVSVDNGDFYELNGTVNKGVSIIKVHSQDKKNITTPPATRKVKISWRDSSRQLCRLMQSAIVFIPGTMDLNE